MRCSSSTNPNESLNADIGRLAPKINDFRESYGARVVKAVGRRNDPHFDQNLLEVTGANLTMPLASRELIWHDEDEGNKTREKQRLQLEKNRRRIKHYIKKSIFLLFIYHNMLNKRKISYIIFLTLMMIFDEFLIALIFILCGRMT